MSDPAFDTLGAARRLKAAGSEAEQADAIVEVMGDSVNQLVTVERFDAGTAMLHTRTGSIQTELQAAIDQLSGRIDSLQIELQAQIDGLSGRIDSLRVEMRADIARSHMVLAGFVIAANALMLTVLGIQLNQGALM